MHLKHLRYAIGSLLILITSAACGGQSITGVATATHNSPTPQVTRTPPPNPNHTATVPVGSTAITPTHPGSTPAYTEQDVRAYLQQHSLMPDTAAAQPFTIVSVTFATSREVSAQLAGESTGYADAAMLCLVLVQGTFAFPSPPGAATTYHHGFLIFDATTGNLVVNGGVRAQTPAVALAYHPAVVPPQQPQHPTAAHSYNCANTHCYAVAKWNADILTQFLDGLSAKITFTNKSGGDGFLDTELWLVQSNNQACNDLIDNTGPVCWVETGMIADATRGFGNQNHYFWADNRPNAAFAFHDMGPVGNLDQNPQTPDGFFITNDGPNTWQVGIVGLQTNSALIFAYSTANPMSPDVAEFGSELFGSNGAAMAGNATFSDLTYYSGEFGLYMNGNPSHIYTDSPQQFNFTETPNASSSGGFFVTHCC